MATLAPMLWPRRMGLMLCDLVREWVCRKFSMSADMAVYVWIGW